MTPTEKAEIDRWIEAAQKAQPANTLALFFYVRDGKIILGRRTAKGSPCPVEMKDFDPQNLLGVMKLCNQELRNLYENGIPE